MDDDAGGGGRKAGPKQKTPLQKEVLEASYMINENPTPEHCRMLAQRIQLTEKEVRDWFSGRRRRVRKKEAKATGGPGASGGGAAASSGGSAPPHFAAGGAASPAAGPPQPRHAAGVPYGGGGGFQAAGPAAAAEEDPLEGISPEEEAQLLELARAALPQPFRADGPPLALRFDALPPGAAPPAGGKRRADGQLGGGDGKRSRGGSVDNARTPGFESAASDWAGDAERDEAARAGAEARAARLESEVAELSQRLEGCSDPAQAEALRAELAGRQAALAEERARAEDAARRAAERMAQQRAREAERLRAAQERELKRMQAQRERERDRQAASHKKAPPPPPPAAPAAPDDADLELEALAAAAAAEGRPAPAAGPGALPPFPPEELGLAPAFAPPAAAGGAAPMETDGGGEPGGGGSAAAAQRQLTAAAAPEPGALLDEEFGGQLLSVWSFFATFGELLGLPPPSIGALLGALLEGRTSRLLAGLHGALVRVVQADLEEAHASGLLQAVGQLHFADQARVFAAQALEEAWAWGFDTHQWRAHLGPHTWPEVLRQLAVACGAGPRRTQRAADLSPEAAAEAAAATEAAAAQAGADAAAAIAGPFGPQPGGRDDLVVYRYPDGTVARIKLPQRFGNVNTVKGACWRILVEADHNGMALADITAAIEARGLRDLSVTKSPEGTVAGALSRDAIFQKVRPLAWALQPHLAHQQKAERARAKAAAAREAADAEARARADAEKAEGGGGGGGGEGGGGEGGGGEQAPEGGEAAEGGGGGGAKKEGGGDGGESDDEASAAAAAVGEPWVAALASREYDDLDPPTRLAALDWLVHQALALPTLRAEIDWRTDEAAAARRQIQEEAKADKRRREEEALSRARAAAEEAQRRLEELQQRAVSGAPVGAEELAAAAAAAAKAAAGAAGIGSALGGGGGGPGGPGGEAEREQQRRLQARAEAMQKVEDACQIRYEPLGLDRRHNRYWVFAPGGGGAGGEPPAGGAPGGAGGAPAAPPAAAPLPAGAADADPEGWGRVWVELSGGGPGDACGGWRVALEPGQLAQLQACLQPRGAREGVLAPALARAAPAVAAAMPGRPLSAPGGRPASECEPSALRAAAAAEAVALAPHAARLVLDAARDALSAQLPDPWGPNGGGAAALTLAALKVAALTVEAALAPAMAPSGEGGGAAAEHGWERRPWAAEVAAARDALELRRLLGRLEGAIDRKLLARGWRPAPPLVRGAWCPWQRKRRRQQAADGEPRPGAEAGQQQAAAAGAEGGAEQPGQEQQQGQGQAQQAAGALDGDPLAWLPPTAAALAWRIASLDAALLYGGTASAPGRTRVAGYRFVLRPAPLRPPLSLAGALAEAALAERRRGPRGGPRRRGASSGGGGEEPEEAAAAAEDEDGDGDDEEEEGQEQEREGGPAGGGGVWMPPGGVMYGGLLAEVGRGRPGSFARHAVSLPAFPDRSLYAYSSEFGFPTQAFASAAEGAREDGTFDLTPAEARGARERAARRAAADARAADAAAAAAARAEAARAAAEAAGVAPPSPGDAAPPAPAAAPPAAAAAPAAPTAAAPGAAPAGKLPPRIPLKIKVKIPGGGGGGGKPTSPTSAAPAAPRAPSPSPQPPAGAAPGGGGGGAPGQRSPTIGGGWDEDAAGGGGGSVGFRPPSAPADYGTPGDSSAGWQDDGGY
ncbi:MAG: hypothetical protein J3K34DRAFT_520971 [Monoraphidium minutum]|nr:MAG: hypothetical protein J3K34DRAFT_520971 [Monoraphidium minutum]